MKTNYLAWLAMGLMAAAIPAQAGPLSRAGAPASSNSDAMPFSSFIDYTVDVSGIFSVDPQGDPLNEVRSLAIGANARVIGIGWDTTQFADAPSWLSEMVVGFSSTSTLWLFLTPGIGDDFPGTESYSSGGVVDLIGLGLDFNVDADGLLGLEFFEDFDDFPDDWDGIWESGLLTIRVEDDETMVPEPASYALLLLGLAGLAGSARRRARQQA